MCRFWRSFTTTSPAPFPQNRFCTWKLNHTTTIYTEETIHLSVPFRELAEKLEQDERFLRCIRGILVNMQHIRGMGKNVFYLPNDIQVPVNIRHQKQIGDTWRAYLYSHMED